MPLALIVMVVSVVMIVAVTAILGVAVEPGVSREARFSRESGKRLLAGALAMASCGSAKMSIGIGDCGTVKCG